MKNERLMHVLQRAHVSEKATILASEQNQYVFKVSKSATKLEVKKAVEELLKVKVDKVRTTIVKGKTRNFGQIPGKRSDWKKAYVSLKEGEKLDLLSLE